MKYPRVLLTLCIAALSATAHAAEALRPPAVPLVTHTPYFSIWSPADKLNEAATQHWTGAEHKLTSLIRVDDKTYRLMGNAPGSANPLPQKSVEVLPLKTIYVFANSQVEVEMTFLSPLIPQDLDILARPVTYVTWKVKSADGRAHDVKVYFDAASEIAVDRPNQEIVSSREEADGLVVLKTGSKTQRVLARRGDDIRIDWGYAYLAAPANGTTGSIGDFEDLTSTFMKDGSLPPDSTGDMPKPAESGRSTLALALDFGRVSSQPVARYAMIAYDEIGSVQYMRKNLPPYWRKDGMEPIQLLKTAAQDYAKVNQMADTVDAELMKDLEAAGGELYADIAALAYRQSISAHGLVADDNGEPLFFSKENNSNGCIATVDVTYPSAPLYLLTSPTLMKAMVVPILDYAQSDQWQFDFAPHDIGQYPMANGQVYGGGEKSEKDQMPVEECGNMLLLVAAISKIDGNTKFADKYWDVLTKWADYLADKGFDPENQLCTDDFAGHLAHNVNLSMKAIEALGGYAMLCQMRGDTVAAKKYRGIAEKFAKQWMTEAKDGNHTKLAFDKKGTWAQKYNLVWDRLLGINLFPPSLAESELAYYKQKQNKYGLPLDNRSDYTKLDWIVWSATLTGKQSDFVALVEPIWDFLNETPDRVPMTDWYWTNEPKQRGFKARSVVGGVFIKLLEDPKTWAKWAKRGETTPGNWAKQPRPPKTKPIIPGEQTWKYTTDQPGSDWYAADYNDSTWRQGKAPFGTDGSTVTAKTRWDSPDIWMRREFNLPTGVDVSNVRLSIVYDEDTEVYINGVPACTTSGFSPDFQVFDISEEAKKALKPGGKNVIASHTHQTEHGQMVDVEIVEVVPEKD